MSYDVFQRVFDVLVVGDSVSALAAAYKASSEGLSTLIVMRRLNPDWEISCALLNELDKGESESSDALIAALEKRSAWRDGKLCPVAAEFASVEILQSSGVEFLMYSTPISTIVVDGRACGIVVAGKSSIQKVFGRVIIDATDDLVLADNLGAVEKPASFSNIGAFVMDLANGDFEPQALTADDGTEIFVRGGIWAKQALVSYKPQDEDPRYYELHLPAVLKKLRSEVPALADAGVTSIATDLSRSGMAAVVNDSLLPSGLVAVKNEKYTLANNFAAGEAAGAEAVKLAADKEKFGRLPDMNEQSEAASAVISASESKKNYDVLIAGGGTSGSLAAVAAARKGVSTLLLEPTNYLGGICTGGAIHMYFHGKPGGLQDEMDQRTTNYDKLFGGEIELRGYNPFARRVALLEMAHESGVDVIFGATVVAVDVKDVENPALAKSAQAQRVVTPTALTAAIEGHGIKFSAKVYVDCTGDGDLAAMAGAQFNMGRDGDGCAHAYTQTAGVMKITEGHAKAWGTNFDAGYVDPYDVTDMTRARLLGLVPLDFDNWSDDDRWLYVASHLGLRQSRQIVGDYQITFADQITDTHFDDCIGFANSHYDNHAIDYENESDAAVLWVWMMGQWGTYIGCEIPYRSLLPVGLENVIVGCRALSLSQDAHHQLRMQHDMQRVGEAAALAAVVAVRSGVTPRNIEFAQLHKMLDESGSFKDEHRPPFAIGSFDASELESMLDVDQPGNGLWSIVIAEDSDKALALPVLKRALKSENPMARFQAAAILAAVSDDSGQDELISAVIERRENPKEVGSVGPLWKVATAMLGRIGTEKSVDAITTILTDEKSKAGDLVLAARALSRIASADAADALRDVLKRTDVDFNIPFKHCGGSKTMPLDDSRWRLELTCSEALKAMGQNDWKAIAQSFLEDDRAYVRRAAKRILDIK